QHFYREQLADCSVHFPAGNPAEDLCLLSHCDFLMGAPSTFTLVAAMYHDTPLYWIKNPEKTPISTDFRPFDELFRQII
ncbi:MAG: glycosyltransferase, partial [Prevotella sp.]|nr:glycosyltransferase [Prevotella sp.]